MTLTVFEYRDYKRYLHDSLKDKARGIRSAMAAALGCQTAYVSQVLRGPAHFSSEQTEALNRFIGHDRQESRFFFLLVQLGRAGTVALKHYLEEELEELAKARLQLKNRLDVKQKLSIEDQTTYYSAWYYGAVHVILSIDRFRTRDSIAKALGLLPSRVTEILEFLCKAGLAIKEGTKYRIGTTRIHLPHDSPLVGKHHSNWRMIALQSLDRGGTRGLHYSSAATLSRADAERIHGLLVDQIAKIKAVIKDSKEEEVHCFTLDFFPVVAEE